jgi:hypothetical protein
LHELASIHGGLFACFFRSIAGFARQCTAARPRCQDELAAANNKAFAAKGRLPMPVLAIGADHSFGTQTADIMRLVAANVSAGVITDSGQW